MAAKAAAIACSIVIDGGGGDEIELLGWRLNEDGGMAIEGVVISWILITTLRPHFKGI